MDVPQSVWVVVDTQDGPEFAAAWREGAHEHIKDCLDEGIHEAARWVVREYALADELTRLRAENARQRGLLLWALYHHQGGSSVVGQPIRKALGIGQFDAMTQEQVRDAAMAAQGDRG